MRTTPLVCFLAFLALAGVLQATDPFVGTWKLNLAKSKPAPAPPGMAVKEETMIIHAISERYEVTRKGTHENGSTFSIRESFPQAGGPITFSEGGPPAGTSQTAQKLNDSTSDFIMTRERKVVSTIHATVSANLKTLRIETRSVDAQGKPVHSVAVLDRH